ncbi:MFS transporter [Chloroflexota bacterium]
MNKPKFFYGWYMVASSWIILFVSGGVAVSIFFKPMLEDFGWDRARLSSVQAVALIAFPIIAPFLGRLIDRFGPKTMILITVATQSFSRVLNGIAANIWHLYLARFLLGVRAMPATNVLLNRWFVKKRGTALGIAATGMSIGTMVLTPISQYFILLWGWRPTMLFWAGVTLVIMLPIALSIKNSPEDKGYSPDGELLDRVKSIEPSPGPEDATSQAKLVVQKGCSFLEAMRTRSFWFLSASHTICGIGCGFMGTHIVIFATDLGYSDMIGASLVSVQGGLTLIAVLVTGALSDKIARKNVLALCYLVRSICFAVIVTFILRGGGSLWLLYAGVALFGFSNPTAPLGAGLSADLFGRLRMGTISGVVSSYHMLGMAIGAYAGGVIFELTQSYYLVFLIEGLLAFLAIIFAFFIKQEKHYIE